MRIEQERIRRVLGYVEDRLGALELKFDVVEANLKRGLAFVADLPRAYEEAPSKVKRRMNQALFKRIWVTDDGEVEAELNDPFRRLFEAAGAPSGRVTYTAARKTRSPFTGPRGLNKQGLVDLAGQLSNPPEPLVRLLSIVSCAEPRSKACVELADER